MAGPQDAPAAGQARMESLIRTAGDAEKAVCGRQE
jgi:hypothetical protein